MAIKMRAVRGFLGRPGEGTGAAGPRAGEEFEVANDRRADELENRSKPLAVRVGVRSRRAPANEPKNEAAETGPLSKAGGETGEGKPSSSSPADRAPRTRRSNAHGGERDSSASTKAGGSRRGRMSSTHATRYGGSDEDQSSSED